MHHRRLARDYETLPGNSESMITLAMIDNLARRLTDENTPTWRDPRTHNTTKYFNQTSSNGRTVPYPAWRATPARRAAGSLDRAPIRARPSTRPLTTPHTKPRCRFTVRKRNSASICWLFGVRRRGWRPPGWGWPVILADRGWPLKAHPPQRLHGCAVAARVGLEGLRRSAGPSGSCQPRPGPLSPRRTPLAFSFLSLLWRTDPS